MDTANQPATSTTRQAARSRIRPCDTHAFVRELLSDDLHAQRVLSIGNGVVGVILELPRSRGQSDYAAIFSIFSLMNFNSNSIGLT